MNAVARSPRAALNLLPGAARSAPIDRARVLLELSKPGIALVVLMTAAAGFLLGSAGHLDWGMLFRALVGTGLAAAGAGSLNMLLERDTDAKMTRTAGRPLPSGRVSPREALVLGAGASVAGVAALTIGVNPAAGALSAGCLGLYLFLYTPMKRLSPWCMLPGAVSGAMPPLIGWAAARGGLGWGGWTLFLILFLWQVPHIVALGWMYREDYDRAGLKMLPEGRRGDIASAFLAAVAALLLIPIAVLPAHAGLAGAVYACGAATLGCAYAFSALGFAVRRNVPAARRLFLTSIAYVPFLLLLLAASR